MRVKFLSKRPSLLKILRLVIALLVPVLILLILSFLYGYRRSAEAVSNRIDSMFAYQMEQVDASFDQINGYLTDTLLTNRYVEEIRLAEPEDIGYVLSTPTVPEFLTGREFLKFFLDINEGSIADPKPIDEYFEMMSIAPEDRDKLLKDYSHGMKNKMQMLINIIAQPNLLLLDEPLTSLDVVVAEEMKQLLRSLKAGRVTIFSTHILDLALDLCDEIVLLNHGELEAVDKSNLDSGEFKDKIIAALREEGHE